MAFAPVYEFVHRLSANEGRFHMPGHKGNPAALPGALGGVLPYDITEIEGADDLQHPQGILAESQRRMARVYGAGASLYSAAGSTACVQALLTLFVGRGGQVVMARNCHLSAVRALGLLGATAHWVLPQNGRPQPADVERALAESGAGAVYITSPDYYGRMADIATLAGICKQYGAALLVDNAHGAHLRFLAGRPHPIALGADACCDSAHKTLPCLTPAALLHLADSTLEAPARRALNLYSSTSPSYPVLQSLDLAGAMLEQAPPDFTGTAKQLASAAAAFPSLCQPGDDPLRLTLWPEGAGIGYHTFLQAFRAAGLEPELADGARIVLMASPWNREADFARLAALLGRFARDSRLQGKNPESAPPLFPEQGFALPAQVCSVRDAMFSICERVAAKDAPGRIAAEVCAPCPPGIPVVIPGERVGEAAARTLARGGISALDVIK